MTEMVVGAFLEPFPFSKLTVFSTVQIDCSHDLCHSPFWTEQGTFIAASTSVIDFIRHQSLLAEQYNLGAAIYLHSTSSHPSPYFSSKAISREPSIHHSLLRHTQSQCLFTH